MGLQDAITAADKAIKDQPHLPAFTETLMEWVETFPAIGALVSLMILDVFTGVLCAVLTKTVSSSASWRGMLRKIVMLVLVLVGLVMEMIYQDIPWARLIAGFLCVTELISITENAGKAGVPLPPQLMATLARLKASAHEEKASIKAELSGIILKQPAEVLPKVEITIQGEPDKANDAGTSGIHE